MPARGIKFEGPRMNRVMYSLSELTRYHRCNPDQLLALKIFLLAINSCEVANHEDQRLVRDKVESVHTADITKPSRMTQSRTRKQKNRVHVVHFWFRLELLQLDSHGAELELC